MGQLEGGLGVSQSCACNCKYHRSVSKKGKKRKLKHPILVTEIVLDPLHFTLFFLSTLHSVYFQMGFMFDTMPSLSFLPQVKVSLVLTFDAMLTFSTPRDPTQTPAQSSTQGSGSFRQAPQKVQRHSRNHQENRPNRNNVKENNHRTERKVPDFTKKIPNYTKAYFPKARNPLNHIFGTNCYLVK